MIKLGLVDNMVYDVIPAVPLASGTTEVNASIFDVQCESISPFTLNVVTSGADPTWVVYRPQDSSLPIFTSQLPSTLLSQPVSQLTIGKS